ncbi:MAG: hypothetical protein IOD12_09900 [Silvanigrellales bacterium]|nr:hypothetical protein [Silvanigrellales bacterium]
MNKNHKCYFPIATFLMALGICAVACSPKTKDESSESKSFIGWLRGAKDLDKFRIANQGKYFEGKTIVDGKPDSELKTCVIAVYENGLEIRNAKDLPSAYNRESHGSFSFASYSYYGMRGVGGGRIENSRDRCINFERKCYDYIDFDEDFALKAFGDMNVVENNEDSATSRLYFRHPSAVVQLKVT